MRRIQKQLGMLLAFLCTVILTGCNDEESNPLRFDQSVDEDNTVDVCFPRSEEDGSAGAVTILGGDGNYTAQCDNAAVLKIDMKYPNAFVLYPQDWGEAHVTVTDGTGASIVLKVVSLSKQADADRRLHGCPHHGRRATDGRTAGCPPRRSAGHHPRKSGRWRLPDDIRQSPRLIQRHALLLSHGDG